MRTRGTSIDAVRRGNLGAVLELVHRGIATSRAQITAATGLNRSTVAALVAELEALGLLNEGDPVATNRVGRPSPEVTVAFAPAVVAVNPEVDAVTVAIIGLGARLDHRVRREVDHLVTPEEAAAITLDVLRGLPLGDRRIFGVGLAIPGLVRASDGRVRWAPHLQWREQPVARLFADRLELPAYVDNDATLGAWAEHVFGVGRETADLLYLNGSPSGIGGGVIVGGSVLRGSRGYAGEFGHNRPGVIDPGDRRTPSGVFEDEVSHERLLSALGLAVADETTLGRALAASGSGSAARTEAERQRRILAVQLANAINVLDPALVVLGGFLAPLYALDPDGLDALIADTGFVSGWERVRIAPAALGENRLLTGAAELVFGKLIEDPTAARMGEDGLS